MKKIHIELLVIVLTALATYGLYIYTENHTEYYTMYGTCMEKFPINDSYKVIVKYDNNEVEVFNLTPAEYITYKVGSGVATQKKRYNWSK